MSELHLGDADHGGISVTRACGFLIQLRFRRLLNISLNAAAAPAGGLSASASGARIFF